jgi:hypothetical protein
MAKECWNRCSECGRYISIKDLNNGKAYQDMFVYWSDEEEVKEKWDFICSRCLKKEKGNAKTAT